MTTGDVHRWRSSCAVGDVAGPVPDVRRPRAGSVAPTSSGRPLCSPASPTSSGRETATHLPGRGAHCHPAYDGRRRHRRGPAHGDARPAGPTGFRRWAGASRPGGRPRSNRRCGPFAVERLDRLARRDRRRGARRPVEVLAAAAPASSSALPSACPDADRGPLRRLTEAIVWPTPPARSTSPPTRCGRAARLLRRPGLSAGGSRPRRRHHLAARARRRPMTGSPRAVTRCRCWCIPRLHHHGRRRQRHRHRPHHRQRRAADRYPTSGPACSPTRRSSRGAVEGRWCLVSPVQGPARSPPTSSSTGRTIPRAARCCSPTGRPTATRRVRCRRRRLRRPPAPSPTTTWPSVGRPPLPRRRRRPPPGGSCSRSLARCPDFTVDADAGCYAPATTSAATSLLPRRHRSVPPGSGHQRTWAGDDGR